MSNIAYLTYPEFIFAHFKYELWVSGHDPYQKKTACDLFNSYMQKLSEVVMPAKKQQQQSNGNNWQKIEFVNINLSKAEKTQFKSWFTENEAELPRLLSVFIAAGYKTSLKWDNENDCFIATATCVDESLENSGKALSSRSDNWLEALALNYFKTDVLSEKGVWESSGRGNSWG
jgi:hypothetical protein